MIKATLPRRFAEIGLFSVGVFRISAGMKSLLWFFEKIFLGFDIVS